MQNSTIQTHQSQHVFIQGYLMVNFKLIYQQKFLSPRILFLFLNDDIHFKW